MASKITIGVIGGGNADSESCEQAYEVGARAATNGAALVCGGLGGIMEAASKGAHDNGGTVIGIIPSSNKADANPYATVVIPTGMGMARNALIVQTADVLVAFPGAFGTLSEMALALNTGKPVVRMPGAWHLQRIGKIDASIFKEAVDPTHAIGLALDLAAREAPSSES